LKLILPRPVDIKFPISSPFGERVLRGETLFHKGIDFEVPVGTKVYAVADGRVVRSGWENPDYKKKGFGLRVMQNITIGAVNFFCWYSHLSEAMVKDGDHVTQGQLIGLSGNTGHSTGPHLHFGIRQQNTAEYFDVDWKETVVS